MRTAFSLLEKNCPEGPTRRPGSRTLWIETRPQTWNGSNEFMNSQGKQGFGAARLRSSDGLN